MEDPAQQGSAGSAGLRHRRKAGPADPDRTSRHDHGDHADHSDHDHDANDDDDDNSNNNDDGGGDNDGSDDDDDSVKIPADGADKKTYGRTPDGTVFTVPRTHDMVSQLLDPRQPKNLTDAAVLAILALHVLAAWALPADLRRPVLGAVFIFWRAAYNIGIGWLLRAQSNHGSLVVWARRMRLFERPDGGAGTGGGGNPRPWLYSLLQRELEAKIPHDYEFATAPGEYNTWLVFRRLVDLILMCDFTSYCLFAVACGRTPPGEGVAMAISRWAAGLGLVGFNLWVKLDAHRVVKDFAWYWGDFFFLIDQELTFDGVFEMAPHPMYSIGYAGYYGISMMAASYQVLFISILAHVAQFAFLVLIENPHIDKIYNPPPPRKQLAPRESDEDTNDGESSGAGDIIQQQIQQQQQQASANSPSSVHNLIGLSNLDLFRVTDYSVILLLSYLAVLTAATARSPAADAIFLAHAIAWRLWYHVGLGLILNRQSLNKMWTRHFVKYGESTNESWRQWKAMCHLSMVMCHASGLAAAWRMYAVPADWSDGAVLLKHVVGAGLVALQMWTAASIYESLGEFGWFFGDFFFEHEAKLTYTSIYRFLNNPERLFGSAAAWGAALVTRSWSVVVLAVVGHVLQLGFLAYVEKPHMQRVFGRKLRREAGLTKFIKRSLPPPVKGWQESVDRVLDDTTRLVEEFVESARPRFAAGVRTIVRDTSALFNLAPARLTITRLAPGSGDVATRDARHYRLVVSGAPLSAAAVDDRATGKESLTARCLSGSSALGGGGGGSGSGGATATAVFEYGAPLRVTWTAPARHDPADWIGLYMVTDNRSRDVTDVSSLGRWAPTTAGIYDVITADRSIIVEEHPVLAHVPAAPSSAAAAAAAVADPDLVRGEVLFSGDKLWWTQGVLELRYHHGGSHTVMAISQPFEVRVGRFDGATAEATAAEEEYQAAVETALLPLVQNCLDRDPDIAPSTVEERFGTHVERDGKYAKRVVYVVHQMFGVEFAPAVVPADGNVRRLAWRICNAKQVLAPYSMSKSRGAETPIESA